MVTLPKSGWPVRGQMDVNSVAVRVTVRTSGAGNASVLRYSRASVGLDGRGSGPVRGSLGGCEVIGRLPPSSLYRCARARNFRKDDQSQAESHRTEIGRASCREGV